MPAGAKAVSRPLRALRGVPDRRGPLSVAEGERRAWRPASLPPGGPTSRVRVAARADLAQTLQRAANGRGACGGTGWSRSPSGSCPAECSPAGRLKRSTSERESNKECLTAKWAHSMDGDTKAVINVYRLNRTLSDCFLGVNCNNLNQIGCKTKLGSKVSCLKAHVNLKLLSRLQIT